VRTLLSKYLDQRIAFSGSDKQRFSNSMLKLLNYKASCGLRFGLRLQRSRHPWSRGDWGMNDVLNSAGYTQAAWWNESACGLGPDGIDRHLLQRFGRLWCEAR
jgi:hypothetical protein